MILFSNNPKFDKNSTIVLLTEEQIKEKDFKNLSKPIKNVLSQLVETSQFSGKTNQIFPIVLSKKSIFFVGLGDKKSFNFTLLRTVVKNILNSSYLTKTSEIEIVPNDADEKTIIAIIEGSTIGAYNWNKYKSEDKNEKSPKAKKIYIAVEKTKKYEEILKISQGVNFVRDLINDNADIITSDYFEKTVNEIVNGKKNIELEILNRSELQEKGLNLLLAVNQASNKEPKLIIIKYSGNPESKDYTALVGKGLTFDTGGLNLKTSGHMETMRVDKSGAACVLGVLKNVLALNVKKNIIFACAMAENAIGPGSYKPGDVYKGYSGKTVEIDNTDAEGRLVLADAVSYILKNYNPAAIIDIATLTGACIIALGHDYSGLFSNDEILAGKLLESAEMTDDRAWRLPNYPEISESIKSKIADLRNTGIPRGVAGALTGAEFLRQFVSGTKWAHIDIAGTAFVEASGRMYFSHGATGAGVRLLTNYFINN